MPRKKSFKRFFKGLNRKMDNEVSENLEEQEVTNEEQIEESTPEVEGENNDVEKKTSEVCPTCSGSGIVGEFVCSTCQGRGVN